MKKIDLPLRKGVKETQSVIQTVNGLKPEKVGHFISGISTSITASGNSGKAIALELQECDSVNDECLKNLRIEFSRNFPNGGSLTFK